MKGIVVKKNADKFLVDGQFYSARGNLKDQGIFVGDFVECDKDSLVIKKVCDRKNLLIRPPIANLDKMIIVVAPIPKPDFLLVDKLTIFCIKNGIEPVICINKCDILSEEQKNYISKIYSYFKVVFASAENGEVSELKKIIKGVCAFAGQSAVGKSSLINALHGDKKEEVGDLAKKTERGKQTTRIVSLYKLKENSFIADTAGFSKLDENLLGITARDLEKYFPEFEEFLPCKYLSCAHLKEQDCEIKKGIKNGKISQERYESYCKIYESLKLRRNYEKKS